MDAPDGPSGRIDNALEPGRGAIRSALARRSQEAVPRTWTVVGQSLVRPPRLDSTLQRSTHAAHRPGDGRAWHDHAGGARRDSQDRRGNGPRAPRPGIGGNDG